MTRYIRRKPASNFHHAIRLAAARRLPLNTFATINYSMLDCPVEEVSVQFAHLRNVRYAHWARRPGRRSGTEPYSPTYTWVIEAGGGVTAVHWLLHVPDDRRADFEERLPGWVEAITGPILYSNIIMVKDAPTPRGLGRYLLKGMEPEYAAFYGVEFKDQGEVHGRRSGYTRNIGPKIKRELRAAGQYSQARTWRPFPPNRSVPRPELRAP